MSSISSAKKGRRNVTRGGDSELLPNEVRCIGNMRSLIYSAKGEAPDDTYAIEIDCLSSPEPSVFVDLDEKLCVPEDTFVERGLGPQVYRYRLSCGRWPKEVFEVAYCVHEGDENVLDLRTARVASEDEVRAALDFEPEPVKPPAPVAPAFKVIPCKAGDAASRLGFKIEPSEHLPVKLSPGFTVIGFHLASPQIIGRIQTSLTFAPHSNAYVELSVFDAAGDRKLYIELTSPTARSDQLRLEAGDHMVVMRCVRGAIEGSGSYKYPNSRVLAELPERPLLDNILWEQSDQLGPEVRCAVPCFEFTSR